MKNIKEFYKFCFYRFYRFSEGMEFAFWSEWKALLALSTLMFFLSFTVFTVLILLGVPGIAERNGDDYGLEILMVLFFGISIINYYIFIHQDKWRNLVTVFDQLPERVRRKRKWLVRLFVLIVLAIFCFCFYALENFR